MINPDNLISLDEFFKEVWDLEHIKVQLKEDIKDEIIMVPRYPYSEPASDDLTVDEFLEQRINPILKQYAFKWVNSVGVISL